MYASQAKRHRVLTSNQLLFSGILSLQPMLTNDKSSNDYKSISKNEAEE